MQNFLSFTQFCLAKTGKAYMFDAEYRSSRHWGATDMPFWTTFLVIVPPILLLISAFAIFFIRDAKEKHTFK